MPEGRLPTFLCIGVPRSGTTWLSEALRSHPEAFVPAGKEINFFMQRDMRSTWGNGLDWYRSLFDFAQDSGIKVWGELSPYYYYLEESPRLIRKIVPDVKIIYLLRHPVEMLHSLATRYFMVFAGTIDTATYGFSQFMLHHWAIPLGFYATYYQRYVACFSRQQILVKFFDQLQNNPAGFFSEVCSFLGIDDRFAPPIMKQQVNSAKTPKCFWLAALLKRLPCYGRLFSHFDRRFNRTRYKSSKEAKISLVAPEVFQKLMHIYQEDVSKLETLMDRDLSGWFDYQSLDPAIRIDSRRGDEYPQGASNRTG